MVKLELAGDPLNREPELERLVQSFITPAPLAYDRNHGPIPYLHAPSSASSSPLPSPTSETASTPPPEHTLIIDGLVARPTTLTITQLRTEFPQHEVLCVLQCAGNRRHTMRTLLKEVNGLDWGDGAVMNCVWRGPRIRDVLLRCGLDVDGWRESHSGLEGKEANVAFACYETQCQDDDYYGGSIPLSRAMSIDAEGILALDMNDSPLPPSHGFPLRALLPGVCGARSVKWLNRLTIQRGESPNFYQQRDYKILPACADTREKAAEWWAKVPAIMEMPVNSAVCIPASNSEARVMEDGCVEVRGYALPAGKTGPVISVEVSGDGGETWVDAQLDFGGYDAVREGETEEQAKGRVKWAWCLWRARVKMEKGEGKRVLSRAVDAGKNTQCKDAKWNYRGVAYNGYGEARDLKIF